MADDWLSPEEVQAAKEAADMFVTVRRGDNLSTLAKRYGTSVEDFVKMNGIANPNKIYIGQKFAIPGRFQIRIPEPEELMAPEPPKKDPWNPAGIEDFQPMDQMIMAEFDPTAPTPQSNQEPQPLGQPLLQKASQTDTSEPPKERSPTERVVDHFVRVYEEFANNEQIDGQKALFALDLLGVLLGGGTMTGRSLGKILKQADRGMAAKTKLQMTHKEAIEAESRVAEGLKAMEPPQPTEAMKKRLETALRARKTPSTRQSFEEGLEWRGNKVPSTKNERPPKEREFSDIDQSKIPMDSTKIDPEVGEIRGASQWVRDPVISAGVAGPLVFQSVEDGYDPVMPEPPLEERWGIMKMPEDNLKPESGPNAAIRNRAKPHKRIFREEPAAE